jgi:membrane-associated phospholipid phosphatase
METIIVPPTSFDRSIAKKAADNTKPAIQSWARAATWAADGKVIGTLVAAAWLFSRTKDHRQRARADHLALTTAVAIALPKIIKKVVDQERPDRSMVGPERRGVRTSGSPDDSFPSGHSVHIGALVSAFSWAYPEKAPVLWLAGGAIAATRIAVLAHWPSDVLVGLALGAGIEAGLRTVQYGSTLKSEICLSSEAHARSDSWDSRSRC